MNPVAARRAAAAVVIVATFLLGMAGRVLTMVIMKVRFDKVAI